MFFLRTTLVVLPFLIATQLMAQSDLNRLWFTWEHTIVDSDLCRQKNLCKPVSRYITRLFEQPETARARSLIGAMDVLASKRGQPAEHPDAPQTCQNVNAMTVLGFDPENWEMSEKLAALRDLPGIYFSVRKLKAPAHYEGAFGDQLQELIEQKFRKSGIRTLTKKQMEVTRGQPRLNIYFSNTNKDTGCWFSVFASLSQTVLLTRNHTVKLRAGTWGMSGGYSNEHPNRTELDAIIIVVDRLIADYWKANSRSSNTATVKP